MTQPPHAPKRDGWGSPTERPGSGSSEPATTETHLQDYFKIIVKHRWTVATTLLVALVGATVHAFTQTTVYEATTRLIIEIDDPNIVQFQQVVGEAERSYYNEYHETQYELLRSRTLIRETLETLELWDDPVFLESGTADSGLVARLRQRVTSLVGGAVRGVLPAPQVDATGRWVQTAEAPDESGAVDVFEGNFAATPVENSNLVDLSYQSPNPRLAAAVVNAHADAYIAQHLEFRFTTTRDATDWLSERLEEQRLAVEESEAALYQYRQDHDAVSLEDQENIVVQRLGELSAAHTRARTDLIARESAYRQLQAAQADDEAIASLPAIVSNRFIQEVRAEVANLRRQHAELTDNLGPRHPEMIRVQSALEVAEARLELEVEKVIDSVRAEYLSAQTQERSLAAELEAQKGQALAMDEIGIGYGVLRRQAESARQIYESLLQRANETGVASELRHSNIRIVDRAEVPSGPISPNKRRIITLAALLGLLGGLGLAFFFEYLDNRIKTPEDLKTHLGLPSLGMVPVVAGTASGDAIPLVSNGVPATFAEAFRSVRTGVVFSLPKDKHSFVITSTGPGEGKSVVSANLGIGLAQLQQRVLLIDADMRRPTLHTALDVDQEPGLSNLIVGNAKSKQVIRRTAVPGLWVLPAGKIPPNPAELLASERFHTFLESLHDHFDWVLIDSPPVMAVTDAAVVAHLTTGVIFVVGADMTSRQAAQQALDQLEAARGRFVGAVLNRVDVERNAYYYSRYYRREYQHYYTQPTVAAPSTTSHNSTVEL